MPQNKNAEIEFFSKFDTEYTTFNDETYLKIFKFVKLNEIRNKLILDAGCGTGFFSKKLGEHNKVVGVDISEEMINYFNKSNKNKKITMFCGDLENETLFEGEKFDIIFCSNVLHHFYDHSKLASNFNHWLKKNGELIIIEPNGSNCVHKIANKIRKLMKFNKFATENETAHSYENYTKTLKDLNFTIVDKCSINLIGCKMDKFTNYNVFERLLISVRNFMLYITNYFPFPFNKNSLIIIFLKT